MTSRFPRRAACGLMLALALATGCDKEKSTASVSGKVLYNGKPQAAGTVNFLSATGAGAQAKLDAGGGFKVDGPLEAGEYKVYLSPPQPEQLPPGAKAPPAPRFTVTPKFQNPESSGVKVTLKPGANEVTIEMKD
jgi:hypothetical protein